MARHLHHEAGGDPTRQVPARELANRPRAPRDQDDFPDAPSGSERRSTDLDEEQLEDFAARLGLRSDDEAGAAGDRADATLGGRVRLGVAQALELTARMTRATSDRLAGAARRLRS